MDPSPEIRYARHLTLPQIGDTGQARLSRASILIVGLGGLGSPASLYLAAAGVGRLVLADFDTVEISNLQRQIAHAEARVAALKTDSARQACLAINSDCRIDTIDHALDGDDPESMTELQSVVTGVDVVLDCSDNFATRIALNKACLAADRPLVIGAAIRFDGQLMVVDRRAQAASANPCYQCFIGDRDPGGDSCAQAGILGPVVGTIGCLQALEAIKLVCGCGESMAGRLLLFDGLSLDFNEIRLERRVDCPACSVSRE